MNIRITLVFAINIIYFVQLFNGLVEADRIVFAEEKKVDANEQNWPVDTNAISRGKRHSTRSHISLIELERPKKKEIDYDSQQSRPNGKGFSLNRHDYDNQQTPDIDAGAPQTGGAPAPQTGGAPAPQTGGAPAPQPGGAPAPQPGGAPAQKTPDAPAGKTVTTTAVPMTTAGTTASTAAEPDEEIISPLVIYVIIAGIILLAIALLLIIIAVVFIICTIPSCDKEEEEDPCAMPKGKPSSIARTPASFSRCPSFSQKPDDRRYSEQSEDLVHKSRGSSLSRQSSCRICPRFAPKSTRGRASCASTMTGSSGGSNDAAAIAVTTAGKKDYFVACVCDLPGEEEYSPSTSTTTTFGRC